MRYNSAIHIFPEQCAKYLKKKFRLHNEITVRELMVVLKHMGIKTVRIHNNGKLYDVFYKRIIDGIQDFEFINNLVQYRREKQIRDEWSKEAPENYDPELSNMQNASDELLRQDDVYYTNESKQIKYNMKRDNKKALYESIMTSVAREVKKALNEGTIEDYNIEYSNLIPNKVKKYCKEHNISYNIIDVIHKKYDVKQKRSEGWHLWYNPMGETTGKVLEVEFIGDNIENNVLYFIYWENEDMDNKLYVSIVPTKPSKPDVIGSILTRFFRVFESKMAINDLEYFLYNYDGNDWNISYHFGIR